MFFDLEPLIVDLMVRYTLPLSLSLPQGSRRSRHLRRATYPPPRLSSPPPSTTTPARPKLDPLPPPLSGCNCSVCNAKQSLGALTLGQALKRQETMSQHTRCVSLTYLTLFGLVVMAASVLSAEVANRSCLETGSLSRESDQVTNCM